MILQLAIKNEDCKKQAKTFDQSDPSVEIMCPECQVTMRLTRIKSNKIDFVAIIDKIDEK